ncbi:DUF4251 domain-containing protein [Seonamhaeicola sp.]|uniref:DUF4251 domain-containing protein n=1 Tax=Seonamhaeicola sp. TaxID=1912245 RepID=UPI00262B9369|nr:DUF4251 domain-containing protein [Seonamhaeicola sp.]
MKGLGFCFGIVLCGWLFACGGSKSSTKQAEKEALKTLINERHFTVEYDWAYPFPRAAVQQISGLLRPGDTPNSINLIGNSNFLTISGDSIKSHLPFYGERFFNAGYSDTDGPITFNGLISDYQLKENKNGSYDMSFDAKNSDENFNVVITLFPGLRSHLLLRGNTRAQIRYSGRAQAIKDETPE